MELCRNFKAQYDKWPDIGSICDEVDISMRTLDNHLAIDEAFREQWEELTLRGEATLTSKMYDLATKNPMYMFGWLRRWNPQRWNPEQKVVYSADFSQVKGLVGDAKKIFDAEIVSKSGDAPANVPQIEETH